MVMPLVIPLVLLTNWWLLDRPRAIADPSPLAASPRLVQSVALVDLEVEDFSTGQGNDHLGPGRPLVGAGPWASTVVALMMGWLPRL